MRRRSTVAAIDVGSTKVAVIVGDLGDQGKRASLELASRLPPDCLVG